MNFDRFSQTKKENAIVYGNERPQVAQNRENRGCSITESEG